MSTFRSTIKLCGKHAIILGHKPDKLSVSQVQSKIEDEGKSDLGQFGLFDRSTPNYSTYYPDVTVSDLNPKDEEFIEPIFRMLSSVTVAHKYNPIFFPEEVLKKSMYKLVGQTVNIDHETAVGNAVGSVKAIEWQNSYTVDGVKVPAGINAVLRIDGKSNPRIARGILMDPPSIHSNSVTLTFNWEKSHPKLSDDEFMTNLGKFDDKGKLIQKIATNIESYHETSLVGRGADPFAQKVDPKTKKIVNPSYAHSRYGLHDDNNSGINIFTIDWKAFNKGTSTENFEDTILDEPNNNQTNLNQMDEKILRNLEKTFGLAENSLSEENYVVELGKVFSKLGDLEVKSNEPVKLLDLEGLEAIETEINTLRAKVSKLPEDFEAKLARVATSEAVIEDLRNSVKTLYNLSLSGKSPDEQITSLIENCNYDQLKALHKQYDELTEGRFGFTCKECGSTEVTRASAQADGEEDDFIEKSDEEVVRNFTVPKIVKPNPSNHQ